MVEQLDISLVECQHCTIEFCVWLGKSGSETLQLIKPMETGHCDKLWFSSGKSALEMEKRT
jgi:hypothetical protein